MKSTFLAIIRKIGKKRSLKNTSKTSKIPQKV